MNKCKDLNDFDRGQIVMPHNQVRLFQKRKVLWEVPSMRWLVSAKQGGPPMNLRLLDPSDPSPTHGASTSQLTGLKGPPVKVVVPDTTSHLQRSCEVNALTGDSCFDGMRGIYATSVISWCDLRGGIKSAGQCNFGKSSSTCTLGRVNLSIIRRQQKMEHSKFQKTDNSQTEPLLCIPSSVYFPCAPLLEDRSPCYPDAPQW